MTRSRRLPGLLLLLAALLPPGADADDEPAGEGQPIELVCTEEASQGFVWDEDGQARATGFAPESYAVTIVSETLRHIALPGLGRRFFDCAPTRDGQPEIVTCTWQGQVFMFRDRAFTTAWLYSTPLGGDPNQALAFGHCDPI